MKPRLLLIELRMMGDAIMALPFVRAAEKKFEVFACCTPGAAEVFRFVLPPDRIVTWTPPWLAEVGKYKWSRWRECGIHQLVRMLRHIRPDVAVTVWADARAQVLAALSGAHQRVGFPMKARNYYANQLGWRKRQLWFGRLLSCVAACVLLRRLLTRKLDRSIYLQHHVAGWQQISEVLGLQWNASTPWLAVGVKSLPSEITRFIGAAHARNEKVWLLHPGARAANRRWPVEQFGKLISEVFLPRNIPFLWIDCPEVRIDEGFLPPGARFRPENLSSLLEIINAADRVVCGDTGVAHAAAAFNKRVVTILSSNLPQWFAPYGNLDLVAERPVCPHRPCFDRCVMPSYICLESVTVDLVRSKIEKVLAE
jgi:heptosyltransferase-2